MSISIFEKLAAYQSQGLEYVFRIFLLAIIIYLIPHMVMWCSNYHTGTILPALTASLISVILIASCVISTYWLIRISYYKTQIAMQQSIHQQFIDIAGSEENLKEFSSDFQYVKHFFSEDGLDIEKLIEQEIIR